MPKPDYESVPLPPMLNPPEEDEKRSRRAIVCRRCGCAGAYMERVNEKGLPGIFECRPVCGAPLSDEESLIAAVDRYSALGIPAPAPETMCPDQCEGTGFVPVGSDETEEPWRSLWAEAEAKGKAPSDDGYYFVRCPTCQGTGKRVSAPLAEAGR